MEHSTRGDVKLPSALTPNMFFVTLNSFCIFCIVIKIDVRITTFVTIFHIYDLMPVGGPSSFGGF